MSEDKKVKAKEMGLLSFFHHKKLYLILLTKSSFAG